MSSLPPISALAGTRTSVKLTSAVHAPSWPILASLTPTWTPGVVGGHQEDRDAGAVVVGGPAAGEDDEQIGDGRVGDEALVPVDDPVCVV